MAMKRKNDYNWLKAVGWMLVGGGLTAAVLVFMYGC